MAGRSTLALTSLTRVCRLYISDHRWRAFMSCDLGSFELLDCEGDFTVQAGSGLPSRTMTETSAGSGSFA
jgi:hypothetical protein